MNWIENKISGRVVADARLYYAGWLEQMQLRAKSRRFQFMVEGDLDLAWDLLDQKVTRAKYLKQLEKEGVQE